MPTPKESKCPVDKGCPFSQCKTKEDIAEKMIELRTDPYWQEFMNRVKGCPIFQQCPLSQ